MRFQSTQAWRRDGCDSSRAGAAQVVRSLARRLRVATLAGRLRPASSSTRRSRRASLTVSVLVLGTVVGATATGTQAQTTKPVLTIGIESAPTTLNPGLDSTGWQTPLHQLSYANLTNLRPNGVIAPELATSWHFIGTGNKEFELNLRHDAGFSDGTPVTAQAVKAWLDYCDSPTSIYSGDVGKYSVTIVGKWTVIMHLATPDPIIAFWLSDFAGVGMIASAKATPAMLASGTDGAGEYVLVPSETVAGNHYTLVPNKYYYQPSAIKYSRVVIDIIPTASSMLAALTSGQLGAAEGDTTTAASAASAGFSVDYASGAWDGLYLQNHGGSPTTNPLASQRVRQALNYAINRKAITTALMGKYSTPTSEALTIDGGTKYTNFYPYDPTKAKQLLSAAGWAKGFTLTVVDENYNGNLGDPMVQALAQELSAIGVTLKITTESTPGAWVQVGLEGNNLPDAFQATWNSAGPMAQFYGVSFAPTAIFNPFKLTDPALAKLNAEATVAKNATPYWVAMSKYITQQAYILPVFETPEILYASKDIGGVQMSGIGVLPYATGWFPR
jgi:peptide/nickel transport system substrate-binding protein